MSSVEKNLLKIKAVFLSPKAPFTWASGIKSPIYCDNRLVLSYPEVRSEIEHALAELVKEKFPEGVFIFLIPPSMKELLNRLIGRARESEELIKERYNAAFDELKYYDKYDYVVINDTVNDAIKRIEAIISAEKCKADRNSGLINTIINGGF